MLLDLEQGSSGWLEWRQGGIGCSDIPIILDHSPWQNPYRLWLLKTGQIKPPKQTRAMKRGADMEPEAREVYIQERFPGQEIIFAPACAIYDDADYIRASVDGWSPELKHGVELKCPSSARLFQQAKEGHIPWDYMLQMYGEMECLDAETWDYQVYFNKQKIIIPVERNTDLWLTEILPPLQEFWERVQSRHWPKPEGSADATPEFIEAETELLRARAMAAVVEERIIDATARMRRESARVKTMTGQQTTAKWENWRDRYTVKMTFNSLADAEFAKTTIEKTEALTKRIRTDKSKRKLWIEDSPPNLVFKVRVFGEPEDYD